MTNYIETRPWGQFEILMEIKVGEETSQDTTVKCISVKPKKRLSYQTHKLRREFWTIVKGQGTVVLNDTTHKAYAGKTFEIPQETKHRIINDSDSQELVFIEVTTGHFDENDIERFEDDFGRARGVV